MNEKIAISIIIPTLNEYENIQRLLAHLASCEHIEKCQIIIADGGSTDGTVAVIQSMDVAVVLSKEASRAKQMNDGAALASGSILWFVHADTLPPKDFFVSIQQAVKDGYSRGGYAFKFDSSHLLLRFNSWMTKLNVFSFRGGDQTLFVTADLWNLLDGYDETFVVMEEYDLMKRAEHLGYPHKLMKGQVLVSARKYHHNSYFKVQWVNFKAMLMFHRGVSPQAIKHYYFTALMQDKS